MSLCLTIGDLPRFVIEIVTAPRDFAIFKASTISFDEPECDIPIATSDAVRCDALITCI